MHTAVSPLQTMQQSVPTRLASHLVGASFHFLSVPVQNPSQLRLCRLRSTPFIA